MILIIAMRWQVYKAKLRKTGDTVAVKVQRPGVLEGICCDLLVLRIMAQAFQKLPNVHTDLLDVLDTWARRFFDELDYIQEVRRRAGSELITLALQAELALLCLLSIFQ